MLDLSKYSSIGEAVRDALETWPREVCLYESDRGEEKERITYREFKQRALPLAKWLQDCGISRREPRFDHHDQSVQMADFRICDFLLWRDVGAPGLQAEAGRAMDAVKAFGHERADYRISHLAPVVSVRGAKGGGKPANRTGHGGAGEGRFGGSNSVGMRER